MKLFLQIQLGLIEYVTEVSGTIGPFDRAPAGVITSLTFITNKGSYGPFGEVGGTPFHIPVQDNGSIVGFFARAGWYVDAFGIYVNPKQKTAEDDDDEVINIYITSKMRSCFDLSICDFIFFSLLSNVYILVRIPS